LNALPDNSSSPCPAPNAANLALQIDAKVAAKKLAKAFSVMVENFASGQK
jgi:hypothetical protein